MRWLSLQAANLLESAHRTFVMHCCGDAWHRRVRRVLATITLLLSTVVLAACQPSPSSTQAVFSGAIMGTDYRITVVLPANSTHSADIEQACLSAMQSVDQSMSSYIADSELSQLNQTDAEQAVELSADLAAVLLEAQKIHQLSDGYFDIKVAKAVDLWGFGASGPIDQLPDATHLQAHGEQHSLRLKSSAANSNDDSNTHQATKSHASLTIDLSGIAKGYAVDKVAAVLDAHSIEHYLVSIGGELRAKGMNIEGETWRVGVEKSHVLGGIQDVVMLNNQAIATSGDYRNYIEIDGKRYSHMIDPRTMQPVTHQLALVSVLSERASTADALATALMAMGDTQALAFVERHQLAAYLVIRETVNANENYRVHVSPQFQKSLL